MSGTEILATSAWKGTVVLAVAFAASAALRRQSASLRHFLWVTAFAALLILPAATQFEPHWSVVRLAAVAGSASPEGAGSVVQTSPGVPVPQMPWVLWLWAIGLAAGASRFAAGAARTSWMARRGRDWQEWAGIRVLFSEDVPVPLAWGLYRPVILLPSHAREWPDARLHSVLMHEREHIHRRDLFLHWLGQAACSLYWFHPLAWLALREFRKQRERACDDAVLARGVAPHEYAGHLVEVLRETAARRNRWADAPAMAESSDFESRVKALLDRQRNRTPLNRRAAALIASAVLLCVAPIAMIHAQSGRAALAGIVTDPSGARIPGCRVTAVTPDRQHEEVTVADAAGEYAFASIPAGEYTLQFQSKGFAPGKSSVTLAAGAAARADMRLEIGQVSEHVAVTGPRNGAPPAKITGTPQRIRVGGNVSPVKLIRQTKPEFPAGAPEGSVVIRAVISMDGAVLNPVVVNTVDERLAAAALDAVKQWLYQPTFLNGNPVETATTITVEFQRQH
jgi:beta-lactamase regulating signal transducer with metallopeptidase domain